MNEIKRMRCTCCGHDFDEKSVLNGVITCAYCGSVFTVAKSTDDKVLNFLDSAELALATCRFDEAYTAYKKAAELDKNEPEAYFGMALAKFKVQYLKNEVSNRLQPICHEVTSAKFSDDPDYMRAYMKATNEQRAAYEAKAAEIDYIQGEFLKLKNSGLEYDCFICVKVTDDETKLRTADYKSADDIYFALREKGYKPFFSERELGKVAGADYEARILYAIYSSECMLVVCGNEEYLQTKWVKNEYTRFLKLVNDEAKETDSIAIAFTNRPIERLPGRNGKLQGIDLKKLDALSKIEAFVESHTPMARKRRQEAEAAKKREDEEQKNRIKELEEQIKNLKTPAPSPSAELPERNERARAEMERKQREEAERRKEEADRKKREEAERRKEEAERKKREKAERIAREKAEAERKRREEEERIAREKAEAERKRREEAERIARQKAEAARAARDFAIIGTELREYVGRSENVEIPPWVTSIGSEAFRWRPNLRSVTIPDGVTSIGEYAFGSCENLTSITIPDSVAYIAGGAFDGCVKLTAYCEAKKAKKGWDKDWDYVEGSNFFNTKRVKKVWGYKGKK